VLGVTHPFREKMRSISPEQRDHINEINKFQNAKPGVL
jgi:hypothetical protein